MINLPEAELRLRRSAATPGRVPSICNDARAPRQTKPAALGRIAARWQHDVLARIRRLTETRAARTQNLMLPLNANSGAAL